MDIQAHINEVWPKLHALAEPAFKEVKTAAYLANFLRKLGYDVTENVGNTTALTAVLDSGKPGPTVAVRTDVDCLLFKNEDGSLEPIHACGHDAHMTIALGVAKLLQEQGLACGRVKILCQPAEEIGRGALAMLEAGALDDVQYALGYHVMPKDMARSGQIIAQINWTACTLMEGEISGLAAHGSQPHLGVNAIDAGAAIVNAINALHSNPLLGGSIKTTQYVERRDARTAPQGRENRRKYGEGVWRGGGLSYRRHLPGGGGRPVTVGADAGGNFRRAGSGGTDSRCQYYGRRGLQLLQAGASAAENCQPGHRL